MYQAMNKEMILTTERLKLVPLNTHFFESTKKYTTDHENTRFMVHMPKADDTEVMEFLKYCEDEWNKEKPSFFEFAVIYNNIHIGSVSVYFSPDQLSAELGYIFDRDSHGNGFATECAQRLITLCREMGVKRMTAHCDSENIASARVLHKIGMSLTETKYGRKNRIDSGISFENSYELIL